MDSVIDLTADSDDDDQRPAKRARIDNEDGFEIVDAPHAKPCAVSDNADFNVDDEGFAVVGETGQVGRFAWLAVVCLLTRHFTLR